MVSGSVRDAQKQDLLVYAEEFETVVYVCDRKMIGPI